MWNFWVWGGREGRRVFFGAGSWGRSWTCSVFRSRRVGTVWLCCEAHEGGEGSWVRSSTWSASKRRLEAGRVFSARQPRGDCVLLIASMSSFPCLCVLELPPHQAVVSGLNIFPTTTTIMLYNLLMSVAFCQLWLLPKGLLAT